jgi:hypothetical protein
MPHLNPHALRLGSAEHKYLYRNLRNGRFEEVSDKVGLGILEVAPARGCAFGDYDNDGDIDIAENCVNAIPQRLHCDSTLDLNWIKIKLRGVRSNRTGIGSRVTAIARTESGAEKPLSQMDQLRSGGSYFSQNDLRMHFGLDQATRVDKVEVRWLSGQVSGVLGGAVQVTLTPTSCEFVRQARGSETVLRIEVTPVTAPHAQCESRAEPLKAIGNQADACSHEGKRSWTAEQVVGTVRDRAFPVRIAANDRSATAKTLRGKARDCRGTGSRYPF